MMKLRSYYGEASTERWPGEMEGVSRLRTKEASSASWLLKWAGILCVLRMAGAPWYVRYFGDHLSKTQPDNEKIIVGSALGILLFLLTSLVARYKAVPACFIASVGFAALCWVDFHQTPDLFEAGLLSKLVLLGILVWASMNAVFSRVMG